MNTINILVEAKKEYTNQLQKILTPRLYEGFKSIYDDIIELSSKELEEKKTQSSSIIKAFQKMLKEIPQWNNDMIKKEYSRIEKVSNCDYIENLIEAVFITNTKILTSVQINNNKSQNIKINIPQACHFIHKCYIESAKEIYKNPYIYDQNNKLISPKEKHNNLRESLNLIDNSIKNAISDLLPIRDILKQGLTKSNLKMKPIEEIEDEILNDEEEITEQEEDIEESTDLQEEKSIKEYLEEKTDSLEEEIFNVNNTNINELINNENIDLKKIEGKEEEENKIDPILFSHGKELNLNNLEEKKINVKEEENDYEAQDKEESVKEESVKEESVKDETIKEEYKNIIYDKSALGFNSLIKKKNENIQIIEENPNRNEIGKKEEYKEIKTNPFIKKIRQNNFLKSKIYGLDKNNSFYKKKYEENSANYNSISDNGKDNTQSIQTLKNVTEDLKKTENSIKIIKNKIMLEEASSDEENISELQLEN